MANPTFINRRNLVYSYINRKTCFKYFGKINFLPDSESEILCYKYKKNPPLLIILTEDDKICK